MPWKKHVVPFLLPAALLGAAVPAAFAQTPVAQAAIAAAAAASAPVSPPATVTITATRGAAEDIAHTAATVSVITAKEIEETNAKDVKDALRYEPGVEVRRQAYRPAGITGANGRAGNEGVNIRGLEGNQVLMLEDGIALPQSYAFGSGSAGRGDYINTDLYERIEVLRGPASAQYGSDGLTGAVNFVTRDPADLLATTGNPTYASLKTGYDSTDRSWGETVAAAFDANVAQALFVVTNRHGHETDNKGSDNSLGATRTRPDPLTYDNHTLFAKVVIPLTTRDTLRISAEALDNDNSSDGLSQLNGAYTWSGYTATDYETTNRVTSDHVKVDYEHHDASDPWLQSLRASVYYRNATTRQDLAIAGSNTAGATSSRSRTNHYGDNIVGGSVSANSAFATGDVRHALAYGVDVGVSRFSTSSEGGEWTAGSGYPEAFPKTTQASVGAFAQDSIGWNGLSVVPGLRFDHYKMTPHPDEAYLTGESASSSTEPTTASSGHALSPRLALLYEVAPAFVPYVQYAHGFRAPSAYQVNSYYNPVGSYGLYYQQVGNPDLKPETSNSIELGLRGHVATGVGKLRYSAAAFSGQYHGFIDTKVVGGSMTSASDPYTVQYVNYAQASIKGVEAKAEWNVTDALTLKGGAAAIRGNKTEDGTRTGIDSVPPLTAVLGAKYAAGERWFLGTDVTYNAKKKKADMAADTEFSTPAYTVFDLHGGLRVARNVHLTAGVDNLFDRKYWRWSDVRGLADSDGTAKANALTAPGRNFNVGMKLDF
jgi:hemoglobin/transferrin/lactoferrin receptor protein